MFFFLFHNFHVHKAEGSFPFKFSSVKFQRSWLFRECACMRMVIRMLDLQQLNNHWYRERVSKIKSDDAHTILNFLMIRGWLIFLPAESWWNGLVVSYILMWWSVWSRLHGIWWCIQYTVENFLPPHQMDENHPWLVWIYTRKSMRVAKFFFF